MATPTNKFLEGPNFIPLQSYDDGTVGVLETGPISKIEDCFDHMDLACGFLMVEGDKVMDVSISVADEWWKANRDDCDNAFEVPEYVHKHLHSEVYADIEESRYNARCQSVHEAAFSVRGL